ncbi:MAG: hypothetical protein ABIQ70_05500 [Dokdonella sp.]
MTLAERVDVSAGREVAGDRARGDGSRANEGTIAGASAGSVSLLRGGLRGGAIGADAGGVTSGGLGIGFCASIDGDDAEAGAGRVACAVICGAAAVAGGDAVVDAVFGEVDVGVDGVNCAGLSALRAWVVGACAMGLFVCGTDADGVLIAVATRGAGTGAVTRALATGFSGCTADGVCAGGRAGVAEGGALIGGAICVVVCGNAGVWRGASDACGVVVAVVEGVTAFAGAPGVVSVGVSTAEPVRAPESLRTAGVGASCGALDVACVIGGKTEGDGRDAGTAGGIGGVDGCAVVAGGSTAGNGKGSVFAAARARGFASDVDDGGFGNARLGFTSASSVAAGFAEARRSGGFGVAGISPGVGTAASAAGDFRLRGVFGRSVWSMRQV